MFLAVESVTSAAAACADAILAAVEEQKERVNRETRAVDTIVLDADEEVGNRATEVRAVLPRTVTRENSEEILEQVNETSPCTRFKHKRRLIVHGYNDETKKATKGRKKARTVKVKPYDVNAQVEEAHSLGSL